MFKYFKKHKGFTLLELIIGILVLGMLVGVAMPKYLSWNREANCKALISEIDSLEKVVQVYNLETNVYPVGDAFVLEDGPLKNNILTQEDGNSIYLLDVDAIDDRISSLKFGDGTVADSNVYLLSTETENIYYAGGVSDENNQPIFSGMEEEIVFNVTGDASFLKTDEIAYVADSTVEIKGYIDKDESITIMAGGMPVPVNIGDTLVASVDSYEKHYYEFTASLWCEEAVTNTVDIITSRGTLSYKIRVGEDWGRGIPEPQAVITMSPETGITPDTDVSFYYYNSRVFEGASIVDAQWENVETTYPEGTHTVRLRIKDSNGDWSAWTEKTFSVVDTNIKMISAGWYHSMIIKANSSLVAWGDGSDYQLGLGTTVDQEVPVGVSLNNVKQVCAGENATLALLIDGSVFASGHNTFGYFGKGDNNGFQEFQDTGIDNIAQIAVGKEHALYLTDEGKVYAAGYNSYGQLGDGSTNNSNVLVDTGLEDVVQIACGTYHSMALLSDGSVKTWGNNFGYRLGDNTYAHRNTPTDIGLTGVKQVDCGDTFSMAVLNNGTLVVWGSGTRGELGIGNLGTLKKTPFVTNITGVDKIDCGYHHTIALMQDTTVRTWGNNEDGVLGNGNTNDSNVPVNIYLSNIKDVSAGYDFSMVLTRDNEMKAWGMNNEEQLGNSNVGISSKYPVDVELGN